MTPSESLSILRRRHQQRINRFLEGEQTYSSGAWYVYGSDYHAYEKYFQLPENFLPRFVEDLHRQGKNPRGLDLLSGVEMLASLHLPGLAVCLKDLRSKEDQQATLGLWETVQIDAFRHRKQLPLIIRQRMTNLGWRQFHLITQRGGFGLTKAIRNPLHHFYYLHDLWPLLADDGLFIAQTTSLDQTIMAKYQVCKFWQSQNIYVSQTDNGLFIRKSAISPRELPINVYPTKNELRLWTYLSYYC